MFTNNNYTEGDDEKPVFSDEDWDETYGKFYCLFAFSRF